MSPHCGSASHHLVLDDEYLAVIFIAEILRTVATAPERSPDRKGGERTGRAPSPSKGNGVSTDGRAETADAAREGVVLRTPDRRRPGVRRTTPSRAASAVSARPSVDTPFPFDGEGARPVLSPPFRSGERSGAVATVRKISAMKITAKYSSSSTR